MLANHVRKIQADSGPFHDSSGIFTTITLLEHTVALMACKDRAIRLDFYLHEWRFAKRDGHVGIRRCELNRVLHEHERKHFKFAMAIDYRVARTSKLKPAPPLFSKYVQAVLHLFDFLEDFNHMRLAHKNEPGVCRKIISIE